LSNHARVLARLNRALLEAFSRRTTDALRAALPLRLALPHLEPLLARNVAKEVRKDALVIARAGRAPAGGAPDREALRELLQAARKIDGEFLAGLGGAPIRIVVPYDEITPLRARRIEQLLDATRRILHSWEAKRRLRAALQACFTRAEFERLIYDDLHLYAQETLALSRAVHLPAILRPARESIAERLYEIMRRAAAGLAAQAAASAFRA
jgi:hypothetical protein